MSRRRQALAIAGVVLGLASAATAAPGVTAPGTNGPPLTPTVEGLKAICAVNGDQPGSWCAAYLLGSAESFSAFGNGGHKAGICVTGDPVGQLSPVFLSWAEKHPQSGGLPMLAGVNFALRERWPC